MSDVNQQNIVSTDPIQTVHSLSRLLATVLGIVLIIVGAFFAIKLFEAIYSSVLKPGGMTEMVNQWTTLIGGEDAIDIQFGENEIKGARIVSIIIVGAAAALLAWLSLGITLAGAKIISWTAGDRRAVKKILKYAFGHGMKSPGS